MFTELTKSLSFSSLHAVWGKYRRHFWHNRTMWPCLVRRRQSENYHDDPQRQIPNVTDLYWTLEIFKSISKLSKSSSYSKRVLYLRHYTHVTLPLQSALIATLHPQYYSNYDLYFSADIISVTKWRLWVGPGSTMVERRGATGFWWGNPRERDHLENLDADGTIILQWIFKKWNRGHGPVCSHSRQR